MQTQMCESDGLAATQPQPPQRPDSKALPIWLQHLAERTENISQKATLPKYGKRSRGHKFSVSCLRSAPQPGPGFVLTLKLAPAQGCRVASEKPSPPHVSRRCGLAANTAGAQRSPAPPAPSSSAGPRHSPARRGTAACRGEAVPAPRASHCSCWAAAPQRQAGTDPRAPTHGH